MTTITCKIPEETGARLEEAARREGVSKSAIVRAALEDRLRRGGDRAAPTAYDLARDLCGVLRGPGDLSSHPRHLEDLGA